MNLNWNFHSDGLNPKKTVRGVREQWEFSGRAYDII